MTQTTTFPLNARAKAPMAVSNSVRITANEDGAVLLDVDHGLCFSLNPLGTRIWTALSQGRSRAEVIRELSLEFRDVACEQITADVDEFLKQLSLRKLVAHE